MADWHLKGWLGKIISLPQSAIFQPDIDLDTISEAPSLKWSGKGEKMFWDALMGDVKDDAGMR